MDKATAEKLIGKEVTLAKDNSLGDITAYAKGWFTVTTDDGEEHKVRAKGFTLMDSDDEVVEEGGETIVKEITEDPSESSVPSASAPVEVGGEITCFCGQTFAIPKTECFKCPACGKWHQVRLHPNLENYVKGMAGTPSGRDSLDIDDAVATNLRGMDLDTLYKYVCKQLMELDTNARFSKAMAKQFKATNMSCGQFLEERYGNLNNGMQRMNLGNLLRGAIKRNADIKDRAELVKDRPAGADTPDEAESTRESHGDTTVDVSEDHETGVTDNEVSGDE